MGTFATGCLVVNVADRKKSARLPNLLVDSGSEATWIPRKVLDSIGIAPAKSLSFRMANGRLIHRDVGYALVRVGRRETADDVVFAEAGDYALLGARTLEGLNLWVDAANKKLVPGRPWPLELVIVPPCAGEPSGGGREQVAQSIVQTVMTEEAIEFHEASARVAATAPALDRPAPLEGGPFVTLPGGKTAVEREPRVRTPES